MNYPQLQLEFQICDVALERQQRLRETMRKFGFPVMLILDSISIKYATGVGNMTIFSTRTPARYLLIFADGPAILYEYFGCEHLARNLATIDEVRPARGLCYVSSGGDPEGQAKAMAYLASGSAYKGFSLPRISKTRFSCRRDQPALFFMSDGG